MKIYELAKEIGVDSKDIVEFLKSKGADVKNHMSVVPEEMLLKVKSNFSNGKGEAASAETEKKTSGIKAVALPEHLLKQVEEEERVRREKEAAREKEKEEAPKEEAKAAEVPKKAAAANKKVHVKLNTQNSASLKKAGQSQQRAAQEKAAAPRQAPKKWVSAKDRIPDDIKAERERQAAEEAARTAQEAARAAAEAEAAAKAAKEAEEAAQAEAAVRAAAQAEEAVKAAKEAEAAAKAAKEAEEAARAAAQAEEAAAKAEAEAEKTAAEAEAVKVHEGVKQETAATQEAELKQQDPSAKNKDASRNQKSSRNEDTRKTNKGQDNKKNQNSSKNSNNRNDNRRSGEKPKIESVSKIADDRRPKVLGRVEPVKESQAVKSLREKLVKGTVNKDDLLGTNKKNNNERNGQQNRNGQKGNYNKDRQGQGKSGQGGPDKNQSGLRNQQNRQNGSSSAPVMDSSKGGRKGTKTGKDRYDKNKGDKFERLENERAALKNVNRPKTVQKEEEIKVITIPETIALKDFAEKLKMKPADLIKKLFLAGQVFTVNDILDFETAEGIALDMDIICEKEEVVDYIAELLKDTEDPEETLVKRPPVVCVMGHVDHGKTSLLDAIRKTNVIAGEAGGITQHIGAYTVEINDEQITFLDTPGHEAFTAMRLRGAMATDVAILVVAADDGVMPQTIEAINHAKAANIHVIVAINKIDKPGANIDKVKQELSDQGLVPEEWGGDTIFVPVSAKKGDGIESLLEMVLLDTEILELRANPDRMARGVVIEAKVDKGRGSVATLLVQKGTLKVGDHVAMGESYGKVRAMINDKGQRIKEAGPSTPVEITGLNGVPNAGDTFVAYKSDKEAKQFAQVFIEENKKKLLAGTKAKMSLDDVFSQMKAGELKELDIIVKADVAGSVEALKDSLEKLSNDEVVVRCIHTGVGNVSESDAILASASNAIIIAFGVGVNADARSTVEHEKVDMRSYSVIYDAIDDVELAMKGMLEPVFEESVIGHIEVRQIFKASGVGTIAGSYVTDGIVKRSAKVRLSRGTELLFDGDIASLKRFNDDAKEVKSGYECGIVLKDFSDIKEGDTMEVYEMKEVSRF